MYAEAWKTSIPYRRDLNPDGRMTNDGREPAACAQHRYETYMIPLSVQYQWPRNIDFLSVAKRLLTPKFRQRLEVLYSEPWKCGYLSRDVEHTNDISKLEKSFSFEALTSAGYYGEHGWAIINRFARTVVSSLHNSGATHCSDIDRFAEYIAIPDLTILLIMEDYECSMAEAAQMAWVSEPFGEQEYPFNDKCPVLRSVHKHALGRADLADLPIGLVPS